MNGTTKREKQPTRKQGRFLAFIHWYTLLNGRSPAEADLEAYFRTSPSAVHQMLVTLTDKGLIERTPGQTRSLRLLVPPEEIPDLITGEPVAASYPSIAAWTEEHGGWIEIGWDYNTDTFARALDEGGMVWGGGSGQMTLEEAFTALDTALAAWIAEQGLD